MRFKKKPIVIEAERFSGSNRQNLFTWLDRNQVRFGQGVDDNGVYVSIPTLEGVMRANLGDWIIKGVKGEFYPCKPDIFEATYELE